MILSTIQLDFLNNLRQPKILPRYFLGVIHCLARGHPNPSGGGRGAAWSGKAFLQPKVYPKDIFLRIPKVKTLGLLTWLLRGMVPVHFATGSKEEAVLRHRVINPRAR